MTSRRIHAVMGPLALLLLTDFAAVLWAETGKTDPAPELHVTVDTGGDATFDGYGQEMAELAREWYPRIVRELHSEGHKPATQVKLLFQPGLRVPGAAAGTTIYLSPDWFKKYPDDIGVVVHELTHVIQAYPRGTPGWVVEGIADYIRWGLYEPHNFRPRIDPARSKYTDSYQTTAAFFVWLEKDHKGIVGKLNAACRQRKYGDELFKEITGHELDELWQAFMDTLKKPA